MTDSPGRLLSKEEREIPRRIQVQKMTPAELSIRAAVDEVEKLPPDQRLTSAVRLLQMARERVADFVDGKPEEEWARRALDNLASAFAADDRTDALLAAKDARIAELEEQVATTEQLRFEENRKACDRRDRIWELEAMLAEQAARLAEAKEALEPFVDARRRREFGGMSIMKIDERFDRAARAYGKLGE